MEWLIHESSPEPSPGRSPKNGVLGFLEPRGPGQIAVSQVWFHYRFNRYIALEEAIEIVWRHE